MIPSKILRKIISQIHGLNLETYSWDKKFERKLFDIQVEDNNEQYSLGYVYKAGCNIGNCLLTSKYINTILNDTTICAGKVEILKGTKNSTHGDHVWIESDELIIDPTLMITILKTDNIAKYYQKEHTLSLQDIKLELSYSDEFYLKKTEPDLYYTSIYRVST